MSKPRSSSLASSPRSTARATALLSFDADRVVHGMVFHLLDDHHAERVSEDSIREAFRRLREKSLLLSVAREVWEAMSNRERLEWLLARSGMQTVYSGRTAILTADA